MRLRHLVLAARRLARATIHESVGGPRLVVVLCLLLPALLEAQPVMTRVSVGPGGAEANGDSEFAWVSADGRWVAFLSEASSLVAGDTNGKADVFVHDRQTGVTTRVSVGPGGAQANGSSYRPTISADGRWVGFSSLADNLVPGDTNAKDDAFVHDRLTGATMRVSVGPGGLESNGYSSRPAISADGRWLAFWSTASNLVSGDTNNVWDVFVRDQLTGTTTRVSVGPGGTQGDGPSDGAVISADGRWVAFSSEASNLVAGDTNGRADVFVHDLATGTTKRLSLADGGAETSGFSSNPSISADGRWVAFESWASSLVPGDTNGRPDVFVHDRQTVTTTRVSVGPGGVEGSSSSFDAAISADGRWVAFASLARNLVADDTNGMTDVFVHDRQTGTTTRVSVRRSGEDVHGHSTYPTISADGRFVAFDSDGTPLVVGDRNDKRDVFVYDRGDGRFEGQVTREGIALTYPNYPRDGLALRSCEPWADPTAQQISLTNIPQSAHVTLSFGWDSPFGGALTFRPRLDFEGLGDVTIPVEYPMDTSQWPVWNQVAGERAVVVGAFATVFKPDGSNVKLTAKWWVRCVQ